MPMTGNVPEVPQALPNAPWPTFSLPPGERVSISNGSVPTIQLGSSISGARKTAWGTAAPQTRPHPQITAPSPIAPIRPANPAPPSQMMGASGMVTSPAPIAQIRRGPPTTPQAANPSGLVRTVAAIGSRAPTTAHPATPQARPGPPTIPAPTSRTVGPVVAGLPTPPTAPVNALRQLPPIAAHNSAFFAPAGLTPPLPPSTPIVQALERRANWAIVCALLTVLCFLLTAVPACVLSIGVLRNHSASPAARSRASWALALTVCAFLINVVYVLPHL